MEIDVLGRTVRLAGQRRAILAVLLVRRGAPVTSERLADELWGERPPPTALKSVQVRIAELRRALPPDVLTTTPAGYVLTPGDLDADRFEAALAAGPAPERLRAALALWRGTALDGIDTPLVRAEAARLEELRLVAREACLEAELAAGRSGELVPELQALVRDEPLRERPRALLMIALYRAGRQADALAFYREGRELMGAELGIEPGPELRALELAILRQDPSLNEAATTHGGTGEAPWGTAEAPPVVASGGTPANVAGAADAASQAGASRRAAAPTRALASALRRAAARPRLAAAGAVVVAAASIALAAALAGPDRRSAARSGVAPPGAVAVIDPATNSLAAAVRGGAEPVAVAVGSGGVWVADAANRTVARIDPRTRAATRHLGTGRIPTALAIGADTVWVANATTGATKGTVSRIPVATGAATTTVLSPKDEYVDFGPPTPSAVALTTTGAWVNDTRRRLTKLSASGAAIRTAQVGPNSSAEGLALGAGALWAASASDDTVLRLDPITGAVRARIRIAAAPGGRVAGPSALAVGFGSVWVADTLAGAVSRIDPRLNAVTATIRVGARPTRIAAGEGAVWVLDAGRGSVVRIDPRRNAVVARIAVGKRATGLAAGAGAGWVSVGGGSAPPRAAPLPATLRPVTAAPCGRPSGSGPRLIVSDLPRHFSPNGPDETERMQAAIRWVLARRGYRAGRHAVAYQACDDSTRELGTSDQERCAANARAFAAAPSVVAVVGPFHSDCARAALPVLNTAPGGPLPAIGPTNTYVGLTRSGPGTGVDEPERSYPTGVRNFVRLVGADDAQGAALATLADRLGARSLYVVHDGHAYGDTLARYVRRTATALGVKVVGTATWDPAERGYDGLARTIASTGADAVTVLGCQCDNGRRLLVDLRRRLTAPLLVSDGFSPTYGVPLPARATDVYLTVAGVPAASLDARGRAVAADLARAIRRPVWPNTLAAAVAAEILLDALARSDGTRASVNAALRRTDARTITGRVRFDAGGDVVAPRFMVLRSDPRASGREVGVVGMVLDRVISPAGPIQLVAPRSRSR